MGVTKQDVRAFPIAPLSPIQPTYWGSWLKISTPTDFLSHPHKLVISKNKPNSPQIKGRCNSLNTLGARAAITVWIFLPPAHTSELAGRAWLVACCLPPERAWLPPSLVEGWRPWSQRNQRRVASRGLKEGAGSRSEEEEVHAWWTQGGEGSNGECSCSMGGEQRAVLERWREKRAAT